MVSEEIQSWQQKGGVALAEMPQDHRAYPDCTLDIYEEQISSCLRKSRMKREFHVPLQQYCKLSRNSANYPTNFYAQYSREKIYL
jgi:hypothetical protein